jgi:hypothetical protein
MSSFEEEVVDYHPYQGLPLLSLLELSVPNELLSLLLARTYYLAYKNRKYQAIPIQNKIKVNAKNKNNKEKQKLNK